MATQGGEHLGTGRIDLAIDTSEFDLGIKRANEQMAGMATGAQEQYAKMNKAERQRIDSLQRQAKTIGLNRQEQLAYNIVTRTTGKVQEDLLRQLQRNTAELGRQGAAAGAAATQFNKYGLSAKQTQAALRQVPAQMTDIFVSLQGGQNPLTVLLQQGGQLKDVFGGVRPAVAALGAQLLALINPVTVTLGIVAGLGVAFLKGEGETNAYGKAIAALGDRARVTVGDLQAMAVGIADANTTQGKAAEALVAVVSSGKIVAEQYQLVAEAAVNMERTTGTAISETVTKFAALATDPVDAVAKLNAEEHFLTAAIYEQIKALQEQGDTQGAATLAMEAYADAVNNRAGEVEENLGSLETAWRSVTTAAKMAWDAMLDVGRDQSSTERIAELSQQVSALETSNISFAHLGRVGSAERAKAIKQRRDEIRKLIRADAAQNRADLKESVEQQANDYVIAQDRLVASTKTADEQRQKKIDDSRALSNRRAAEADKNGLTELAAKIRANQEAYEKGLLSQAKKPRADRGIDRSTTRAGLQEFKDTLAEQQAAIKADTAVLRAEYAAKLVTQEEYFAASRALAEREMQAQEAALVGQIDFLRNRNVTGKEAIDVQRELGKLEAELSKQRTENASQLKVLAIQEQAYARARTNMLDDYTEALDDGTDALREQIRAQIDRIGMGQREFELQQRINQQLREGADEERRLAKAKRDGQISTAEYARQSADNERATRERVAIEQQAYADIEVAQQNWQAGMRAGLQDWVATASDVAGQVRDITISSLDRIADGFAELAITGKLNWRALLTDILAELVKFFAKQAVLNFVKAFAGALLGGGGGVGAGTTSTIGTGSSFAGYAAKGWAGTSPTLDSYRNTVVNQPTPFYFAKGASFGVMGEAGAEAIMPLSKGPDGTLGVKSYGGGAANVSVGMEFNIQGGEGGGEGAKSDQERAYREFASQMRNMADQQIQRALRPNGTLWKAGVRAV